MHAFWDVCVRPNPPWSTAAVKKRWKAIERLVGAARMPVPSGEKLREFGSGRYGVALPTRTKGLVLKITTDASEAYAAAWLAPKPPTGIVRYSKVIELRQTHRGRTIYLLWREEATYVGGVGYWAASRGLRKAWKLEKKLLEQTTSTAQTLVHRILTHPGQAKAFRRAAKVGYDRAVAVTKTSSTRRFSALQRAPTGNTEATVERVVLGARMLSRGSVIPEVGRAMVESFARGVFLSDVHAGNIGVATRGRKETVVITDPGNAILVRARRAVPKIPRVS